MAVRMLVVERRKRAEEVKQHTQSSNGQAGVRWPSDGQQSTVKKINPFYAYAAQETSLFILLF